MKTIRSIFLLLAVTIASVSAQAEIAVIANKSVAITSIAETQAAAIFLSQLDVLEDGTQLIPVDQKDDQETRTAFYVKVIKKDAAQLNAYWSRMVFSGQGQPPKKMADDAAVLAVVRANPNVSGYVDAVSVNNSVKVLLRIP